MFDLWIKIKTHKQVLLFLGFLLILLSVLFSQLLSSHVISGFVYYYLILISFGLGFLLFLVSSICFLFATTAGENSWKNLSYYVIILALSLWVVISTIKVNPTDIVNIQNTYITIDIAILSVTFAAIAINSDHLIDLLKKVKKVNKPTDFPFFDIERFQSFIIFTAFMILFSIFVSVVISILSETQPLFGIIYLSSFLFGMTTCITSFLIFLLMGYLSVIIDRILNPDEYESPKTQ
jgi:hypothetical protein